MIKNHDVTPGSSLYSFDVVDLFRNIPKAATIQSYASNIPQVEMVEFFDLLNSCWSANYSAFGDQFFVFPKEVGIPIGCPLGPLISEIFVYHLERNILSNHSLLSRVFRRHLPQQLVSLHSVHLVRRRQIYQILRSVYLYRI